MGICVVRLNTKFKIKYNTSLAYNIYTLLYTVIFNRMNGRRLYREYAQSKGKEAKEFVKIEEDWYNQDTLITKDNKGNEERTSINYKDLVNWIIRTLPNGV